MRHVLVVLAFALIAVGQTIFGLDAHVDVLGGRLFVLMAINAAVMVALAYLNLYVLSPRLLLKGRYVEYLFVLAGGIAIYIVGKWVVEFRVLASVGVERGFSPVTVLDWLSSGAMCVFFLVSSSATLLFRQWIEDTRRISELENPVEEFKSRVDAPLLYRVLGYAAKKVKTDPARVSEIIFRLSERLLKDLYEGKL